MDPRSTARRPRLSRRRFLAATGAAAVGALLPLPRPRVARADPGPGPPLLFIFNCFGGASILDSFLPVGRDEVLGSGGDMARLAAYPDALIKTLPNTPIRALKSHELVDYVGHSLWNRTFFGAGLPPDVFLAAHHADMAVLTCEASSVSHHPAARRFMHGNGVNGGRTLLEAAAMTHGAGRLIPAVNMAVGGYRANGTDATVPDWARAWGIGDTEFFGLMTHGQRGILGLPGAPDGTGGSELVARARTARAQLETLSPFAQTFRDDPLRGGYINRRDELLPLLEGSGAIEELLLISEAQEPALLANGLKRSPTLSLLPPEIQQRLTGDVLMRQALLGLLLARDYGTVAVSFGFDFEADQLGPKLLEVPLGFDRAHDNHPAAQAIMWSRVLHTVDFFIGQLKAAGLWERSLVVLGTEFGRTKSRPLDAESFGTAHHANNGMVILSPRIHGSKVYGAVDPVTLLTRRYDFDTSAPVYLGAGYHPGAEHVWTDRDIYGAIAQIMDVPVSGAVADFSGLLKHPPGDPDDNGRQPK